MVYEGLNIAWQNEGNKIQDFFQVIFQGLIQDKFQGKSQAIIKFSLYLGTACSETTILKEHLNKIY